MFSISLTGHVDAGESSSEALERELKEELGIKPQQLHWLRFLFSFRRDAVLTSSYKDRQFNDVYAGQGTFDIRNMTIEIEAISELKVVSFSEFERMVNNRSSELAPVYEPISLKF